MTAASAMSRTSVSAIGNALQLHVVRMPPPHGFDFRLGENIDALPKRDSTFDLLSGALGLAVIPDGIFVRLTVHRQRVIVGYPLPRANAGMRRAL
jgi:hypothetical protein